LSVSSVIVVAAKDCDTIPVPLRIKTAIGTSVMYLFLCLMKCYSLFIQ